MTCMLISRAKGERNRQVGWWGLFSSHVGKIPVKDIVCQAVNCARSGTRLCNICQSIVELLASIIKNQIVLLGLACAT